MLFLSPHHKPAAAAPPGNIITDGLIDLWDYSEKAGGVIGGYNGNDADLLNSSFTGWRTEVPGPYEDSYEFAGGGEQGLTPVMTFAGLTDFSICTWVHPLNNVIAYTGMVAIGAARPGLYFDVGNGQWGFLWVTDYPSGDILPGDQWSFLVGLRESNVARFYRDAVQTPTTPSLTRGFADFEFQMGGRGHPSQTSNCRLAMTRIYDRAITQGEIDLMFAGNG